GTKPKTHAFVQKVLNRIENIEERNSILCSTTDVINLPGRHVPVFADGFERPQQILHREHIPHLLPVTVYRYLFSLQSGIKEMGDPSLILGAKLPRTGDAGH